MWYFKKTLMNKTVEETQLTFCKVIALRTNTLINGSESYIQLNQTHT
jgi:hypothetical protein